MSAGVEANILNAINEKKARLRKLRNSNNSYLYLSQATLMVRCKELHNELIRELSNHIMILNAGRRFTQKFPDRHESIQLSKLYPEGY